MIDYVPEKLVLTWEYVGIIPFPVRFYRIYMSLDTYIQQLYRTIPFFLNVIIRFLIKILFAVYFHSSAYDPKSKRVFIFGGNTGDTTPKRMNCLSALGFNSFILN